MESNKIITKQYSPIYHAALKKFCIDCEAAGYQNNSINTIKLEWCLAEQGQFFISLLNDEIISVSGCHPLTEINKTYYRILFRGATLPRYQNINKVVSKTHMNSIPFFYHVPYQIEWGLTQGYDTFVVSTNCYNSVVPSMNKSHNIFKSLEKQKIVTCLIEKTKLFYVDQTVWRLNIDNYLIARNNFKIRHGLY